MARKKKKGDEINTNAWMDTYADTVTLLLTFFILLYSISSVDAQKLKELALALQQALVGKDSVYELGDLDEIKIEKGDKEAEKQPEKPPGEQGESQGQNQAQNNPPKEPLNKDELKETLEEIIEQKNLADSIKLVEDEKGIILQLHESLLFDSGKAQLKATDEILDALNTIINSVSNNVLIEGNTDNTPIHTSEFPSNWELSTARAVSVARHFIDCGVEPKRITVKGFGEYNPIAENDTPENKSLNRRVDILILDEEGAN